MPVAAYTAWQNAGRPIVPAQHIRELVDRLKAAFPAAAQQNLFSWYADEAHYTAVPAEDHTPFSQTGWPGISPQWYVFATDVMHRPDLGVDCNVLFAYWLAEAKAGRVPWLKYMIWQGQLYDVRNGWRPVPNSGHFDHIHTSGRTDHVNVGLGAWSPVPRDGDEMLTPQQALVIWNTGWITQRLAENADPIVIPEHPATDAEPWYAPGATLPNALAQALAAVGSGGGGGGPTAQQIATAVVDEEHKRLAG